MKINKKIIIILASVLIFFNPVIATTELEIKDNGNTSILLPEYTSNIQIFPDLTWFNSDDSIDFSIIIPITVKYQTTIPFFFRSLIPFPINYLILFGQLNGPMQKIHLEVLNHPSWANIYISNPDLLTDIPFDGKEDSYASTNLVVSFDYLYALAQPYSFKIKASCDPIGHLLGTETTEKITITPPSIQGISINVENANISAPAGSLVDIKIEISNEGNTDILVKGSFSNEIIDDGVGLCLTPSFIRLNPYETKEMFLHFGIPKNCKNCSYIFPIDFSSSIIYRPKSLAINKSVYFEIHGFLP
jgi:hypothetical protein